LCQDLLDENDGRSAAFVINTTNPTTGYVFVLRRADLIELDWSVEEAVKMVISGGVAVPPSMPFGGTVLARPPVTALPKAPPLTTPAASRR